ncbi:hypothetical protein [Clostridium baratii]|nr:hypothetical protein [Clostridium baratii]
MNILFYIAIALPLILVIGLIAYNVSKLKKSRDNTLKKREDFKK